MLHSSVLISYLIFQEHLTQLIIFFETVASFSFQGPDLLCFFPPPHWLPLSPLTLMNPSYFPKCHKTPLLIFSVHTHFPGDLFQYHGFKYHKCIDYSQIHISSPNSSLDSRLMYSTSTWVFLSLYLVSLGLLCTEEEASILII